MSHKHSRKIAVVVFLLFACGIAHAQLTVTNDLQYWFRADSITNLNSGDPVALWEDSSALGNDASQASGAAQPLWFDNVYNGMPVVRFDGSDFMTAPSTFASTGITAFVLGNLRTLDTASGAEHFFFHLRATNFNFHAFIREKNFGISARRLNAGFGGIQVSTPNSTIASLTNRFLLHSLHNGGDVVDYRTNNAPINTFPAQPPFNTLYTNLYIGNEVNAGFLNGDISELLIYNGILTASDRQLVSEYFIAKYSIPEPGTLAFVGVALLGLVLRRRRS